MKFAPTLSVLLFLFQAKAMTAEKVGPYDITVDIADSYPVEYKSNGWYSTLGECFEFESKQ